MAIDIPNSSITVVRKSILEFLEEMKKSKRIVEQEIRDQTDGTLTMFLNQGQAQFTRNDIQKLGKRFRETFLNYYNNNIHLKIISNASHNIKEAIEEGFDNPQIIQQEWMEGIEEIKGQLVHMNELARTNKIYKEKIEEQAKIIEELSNSTSMSSSDLELYQNALEERDNLIRERDQIIMEKNQEIENLTTGLNHMEEQSNNLGQSLLQYNMTIEELQEAVNAKDEEISSLKLQLQNQSGTTEELDILRKRIAEQDSMIKKLKQEVSNASTDLLKEIQDSLEKTRTQLLEARREIVQKNDKIHHMEMEKEEILLDARNANEKLKISEENLEILKKENETLHARYAQVNIDLADVKSEIEELTIKLQSSESKLKETKEKLSTFEGKVTMSAEEKERLSARVKTLDGLMEENKKALDYLSKVIGSDIKFKTLFFLQSINSEIRIDNLAQGVGIPINVAHRAIIELDRDKLIETRKDGRFLLVKPASVETPFALP